MKIRNLAFCGVMASILGVSGAYAAGDATIIASKAYVDARDNLKQNEDKRVTTTLSTYNQTQHSDAQKQADYPSMYTLDTAVSNLSTTIGTNALDTNVLAAGVDGTKLTKASAITAAKSTAALTSVADGVVTMGDGDDTHFPTTKAVADTLKDLDHKAITANNADTAVSVVTQSNGQVSVTSGTLSAEAIDNSAKTSSNVLQTAATDDRDLVVVAGVKNTVAKQGTLDKAWNEEFNETAATNGNATNLYKASINDRDPETNELYMDDFVPTVAAVEKRVQVAERNASSNLTNAADTAASATWDSTNNTINIVTTANTAGNQTNKLATSNQVQTSVSALKSYVDNADSGKADKGNPTGGASGVFSVVKYNADGAVTAGVKLNTSLENINSASGASTCSNENPCVLTYTGRDYKWTNMDTDGLAGVNNTTQNAAETNVNS